MAKPQTGHINQTLHIFKYLKTHIKNDLSFDPLHHNHAHSENISKIIGDMKEVYVDAVDGSESLADLLTKSVPGHRQKYLRSKIMFSEVEEG